MTVANIYEGIFFKKDGDKLVIDKRKLGIGIVAVFTIGISVVIFFVKEKDTSSNIQVVEPLETTTSSKPTSVESEVKIDQVVDEMLVNSRSIGEAQEAVAQPVLQKPSSQAKVEYKAAQVIRRGETSKVGFGLPIGTNLIGKLLTTIDTRETKQLYKTLLPYGGRGKNGTDIPKNTVLFGTVSYPGKGDKVFINYIKALLPNGKELDIKAQALNSKDFSPGVIGEYHGKSTERIVSTLGLSMVSAMSDTMTEKESLGFQSDNVTPKATAKNAALQGISKVSEMERQRQAAELASEPEYVTIDAGSDLIVNLVETYFGDL